MIQQLEKFSDEELEKEIAERRRLKEKPKLDSNPDLSNLIQYAERCLEELAKPNGYVKDFQQHVFEYTMSALYGTEFWKWYQSGPSSRGGK
jgi:hypothetical protein